jgi:PKD repeat protein
VISEFSYEVRNEKYDAPATLRINNETVGANVYLWSFEGGIPQTSDKKDPGEIRYLKGGKYMIRLEARNDFHQSVKELEVEIDSSASIHFVTETLINSFVPAEIKIHNLSVGAETFEWIFEGGNPSSCKDKEPPLIRYEQPGEYEISLSATSGRKTYTMTEKIVLLSGLKTDFTVIPSVESEDMEAQWKGYLRNETCNGISYHWVSEGGKILNDTAFHTEIQFSSPGNYIVCLEADNRKEKIQKIQTIRIEQNSNIYRFTDIKLGINTASSGYAFSSRLRKAFLQNELDDRNGPDIDFVFFGLNSGFNYWTFVSPDKAQNTVFEAITNAIQTRFILFPERNNTPFTITDFDEMTDDSKLREITFNAHPAGEDYFTSGYDLPKLVLFETGDGRKGVIKIKEIIDKGLDSYIVVDIKIQKNHS